MRRRTTWHPDVALAVLALASLLPIGARADLPPTEWHSGAEAFTDVPLGVGARLWGEGPLRIRLEVSGAILPSAYGEVIQALYPASDSGPRRGELAAAALSGDLVGAIHMGWRPLERAGLYLAFGYRFAGTLLKTIDQDALARAAAVAAPSGTTGSGGSPQQLSYAIRSQVHALDGEVGWQWLLADQHLSLRAAIGISGVVASSHVLAPAFNPGDPEGVARFEAGVINALRGAVNGLVTPYLGVSIGYNFVGAGQHRAPDALPSSWDRRPSAPGFDNQ